MVDGTTVPLFINYYSANLTFWANPTAFTDVGVFALVMKLNDGYRDDYPYIMTITVTNTPPKMTGTFTTCTTYVNTPVYCVLPSFTDTEGDAIIISNFDSNGVDLSPLISLS